MVEDLAQPESLARVVNELQMMIKRLVPVRFGIVSLLKEENNVCKLIGDMILKRIRLLIPSLATMMAQSLHYIIEEYGKGNGMKFLARVSKIVLNETSDINISVQ